MKFLGLFCLFVGTTFATSRIDTYLEFLNSTKNHLGTFGSHTQGEIEIITDKATIGSVENECKQRLIAKGYAPEQAEACSNVGIINEDQYWLWVRDAVIFPTGHKGTYNRILWRSQMDGPHGAMVIPVFKDGRVGLVLNFRHATREWHLQLPVGVREPGESIEETAKRELKEETGFDVQTLDYVATITPDNGVTASRIPIFRGLVNRTSLSNQDETEAIEKSILVTQAELLEGIKQGYLYVTIQGKRTKAACNDPSLFYATLKD